MSCGQCGASLPSTRARCPRCGWLAARDARAEPPRRGRGALAWWVISGVLIACGVVLVVMMVRPRGAGLVIGDARPVQLRWAGGVLSPTEPSELAGLTIEDPTLNASTAGRYQVSASPIIAHGFGGAFSPLTPLITVAVDGGFADRLVRVTIPIRRTPGKFPMAFFVHRADGALEGMPTLALRDDAIVIGTAHFSDLVVSEIDEAELLGHAFETGFAPGRDDWPFPNHGSALEPGGHCSGQSATAIWYYAERRRERGAPPLHGAFDNNRAPTPTPELWQDDSRSYRLASMVQRGLDWGRGELHRATHFTDDHALTWRSFAYAMKLSGLPQLVAVYTADEGAGHALVAYAIDEDGALRVADPNHPGDASRRIAYRDGRFAPYASGSTAAQIAQGQGLDFPRVYFYATSALIDYAEIEGLFGAMERGALGDGLFPALSVRYREGDDWLPLPEHFWAEGEELTLALRSEAPRTRVSVTRGLAPVRWVQADLPLDPRGATLLPLIVDPRGDDLGLYFEAQVDGRWYYLDFVRAHLALGPHEAAPRQPPPPREAPRPDASAPPPAGRHLDAAMVGTWASLQARDTFAHHHLRLEADGRYQELAQGLPRFDRPDGSNPYTFSKRNAGSWFVEDGVVWLYPIDGEGVSLTGLKLGYTRAGSKLMRTHRRYYRSASDRVESVFEAERVIEAYERVEP